MERGLMRIGEIASFYNVSAKALRIYEQKNIIKPVKVDKDTGYRYYSAQQVKDLATLLELQSCGFSLNEIADIMSGKCSQKEFLKYIEKKKKEWQEMIWKAEQKMEVLSEMKKQIDQEKNEKDLNQMSEEERAWFLAKLVCVEDIRVSSAIIEAIWL